MYTYTCVIYHIYIFIYLHFTIYIYTALQPKSTRTICDWQRLMYDFIQNEMWEDM